MTPWRPSPDSQRGDWYLELELRPTGLDPAGPVPAASRWMAVVAESYPVGPIHIFPAAEGGIAGTFPHQEANDAEPAGIPWRYGKLCLVDTLNGHQLAAKSDDPLDAYSRLVWHVWRALGWLRRASTGTLLATGEPFELPIFGQFDILGARLGFHEGEDSFGFWQGSTESHGFADLAQVGGVREAPVVAVQRWRDAHRHELLRPPWGRTIAEAPRAEEAIWLRFERLMVRTPWRSPQTFGEILDFAQEQGVDVLDGFRRASSIFRDGKVHFVLFGFPVPQVMGEPPSRMAWVAFRLGPLTPAVRKGRKDPTVPGFRNTTGAWFADRMKGGALANDRLVGWVKTENWHPDELAARGRFDGHLANRKIVLLGAGALGAMVGDLLVRGGAEELSILDGSVIDAGNLTRHELTIRDIGQAKSTALANQLTLVSPNARVFGYDEAFPPTKEAAVWAVEEADLIIDATASEELIKSLGSHSWPWDLAFASISFSFGAERLYIYLASGDHFPSDDFLAVMGPWIKADERPTEDFPHEGTGCWSSVFPARADDVALLAAIAVRHIDGETVGTDGRPRLTVFERHPDGTVSILANEPKP